jgi:hypothetical protein
VQTSPVGPTELPLACPQQGQDLARAPAVDVGHDDRAGAQRGRLDRPTAGRDHALQVKPSTAHPATAEPFPAVPRRSPPFPAVTCRGPRRVSARPAGIAGTSCRAPARGSPGRAASQFPIRWSSPVEAESPRLARHATEAAERRQTRPLQLGLFHRTVLDDLALPAGQATSGADRSGSRRSLTHGTMRPRCCQNL